MYGLVSGWRLPVRNRALKCLISPEYVCPTGRHETTARIPPKNFGKNPRNSTRCKRCWHSLRCMIRSGEGDRWRPGTPDSMPRLRLRNLRPKNNSCWMRFCSWLRNERWPSPERTGWPLRWRKIMKLFCAPRPERFARIWDSALIETRPSRARVSARRRFSIVTIPKPIPG